MTMKEHRAQFTVEAEGIVTVKFYCGFEAFDEDKPCSMWKEPNYYDEEADEYENRGFIPGCGLLEWYEAEPSLFPELFDGPEVTTQWFPIKFTWMGEEGIESWRWAEPNGSDA
jgi:hypothetical protein